MALESKLTEQQLFDQLISSLVHTTWVSLGKIKNPMTDKIEKDIVSASINIDMIDMLYKRMDGNLSDDEKSKLGGIIEANINEITVSIGTQLEKIYDSGVDGTYKYGNTSTQSFYSSLYFTMFKPICIGLYVNTSEKLQLYNHGLRRQYETLDEFGLTISYQI